jgi:hypothetical protein
LTVTRVSRYDETMIKGLDDLLDEATDEGQIVGTWGYNSNLDFTKMSREETNVWFFEQVFHFLRAFFGLVMPDSLEVITYNATQHIEKKGMDQQTFLDELMLVMKQVKQPLWTLRINLTIIGFLRTDHDPDNPVRLKIQEPCSFIVWGGPDETGFQTFSLSYNFFKELHLEGEHNQLWSINQPLLEKALRRWEEQTGHFIEVVDSNGNQPMSQYGFQNKEPTFAP